MSGPEMSYESYWAVWGSVATLGGIMLLTLMHRIASAIEKIDRRLSKMDAVYKVKMPKPGERPFREKNNAP